MATIKRRRKPPIAMPLPAQVLRKDVRSWNTLDEPSTRRLRVYALDPSAGNYVGNVMTVNVRWEKELEPGPIGRRIAVIDYDPVNKCYYPPINLNDYRVLAQDGLEPSESDPRFHQQMVYAVATETVEKFDAALGRRVHWRRAERPNRGPEHDGEKYSAVGDIWTLRLYPHAMVQQNAFYSREAQGILFGYFRANPRNPGNNLPNQRVFTCLSHDIIAHEVTHAVIDGIRTYFTEPTNPDTLAFHEAFADLTALFLHFGHKEALYDTIQKTGGRLYDFELRPDADLPQHAPSAGQAKATRPAITAQIARRNPLIELAKQFGEASGMNKGLRSALGTPPDPKAMEKAGDEPHARGSLLVAAVFDAYFSVYIKRTSRLFQIFRAGGGVVRPDELPAPLADLLAEQAYKTANEFFQLCARALDYCPPVDLTFGDFLRALMTTSRDLDHADAHGVRDALMQAFRARGIYPDSASFFSDDALCWPLVARPGTEGSLPAVKAKIRDKETGLDVMTTLAFGGPSGMTAAEKDQNGSVLRAYAWRNAKQLGFDDDPRLPDEGRPNAASFHTAFRVDASGRARREMIVELVQTRRVGFDPESDNAGTFPLRAGVTLIIAAPAVEFGVAGEARVRFAIGKPMTKEREDSQRRFCLDMGLNAGDTTRDSHFAANFGLVHQGL